jgi:hypothetical protein
MDGPRQRSRQPSKSLKNSDERSMSLTVRLACSIVPWGMVAPSFIGRAEFRPMFAA